MTTPDPTPAALRNIPLFLVGAGGLVMAGLGLFWFASSRTTGTVDDAVTVTVDSKACTPMTMEVPAGSVSFKIVNASDRPLEWEILDGVMVVAERENIAPGYSSMLTERLKPGTYDITCGLLSNPRGKLTVLATAQSEADRAAPPLRDFIGPLAERQVQLILLSNRFAKAVTALQEAIAAGSLDAARSAWTGAATAWAALGPIAPQVSDLRNRIAPQADFLAQREADAGFIGLGRIEYALFTQNTLDGLLPVAEALSADAAALQTRVKALQAAPEAIAGDAARHARALADSQIAAGLNRYAGDDGAILAAAIDGIRRSSAPVMPLVTAADPEAATRVEAALTKAEASLAADPLDRPAAAAAFAALADALEALNAKLGVEN